MSTELINKNVKAEKKSLLPVIADAETSITRNLSDKDLMDLTSMMGEADGVLLDLREHYKTALTFYQRVTIRALALIIKFLIFNARTPHIA